MLTSRMSDRSKLAAMRAMPPKDLAEALGKLLTKSKRNWSVCFSTTSPRRTEPCLRWPARMRMAGIGINRLAKGPAPPQTSGQCPSSDQNQWAKMD